LALSFGENGEGGCASDSHAAEARSAVRRRRGESRRELEVGLGQRALRREASRRRRRVRGGERGGGGGSSAAQPRRESRREQESALGVARGRDVSDVSGG